MDDDELITRLAGGDDRALRELFTRHAPMLAARLMALLPPSDVEDVLQETFLAAWKGAAAYKPEARAGGWLWGIARRQAALLLRRRGPAHALLTEDGPGPVAPGDRDARDLAAGDPAETVASATGWPPPSPPSVPPTTWSGSLCTSRTARSPRSPS